MMKNRKGQEEIVGFAVIVVLVAVIALIFLAIYIRRPVQIETKSLEIENFLQSSLHYTTQCEESTAVKYELQDLIKACNLNENCLDGENTCKVMENTIQEVMNNSWIIGQEAVIKGYTINITADSNSLLFLENGNKTSVLRGSRIMIPSEEKLYWELEMYY